MLVAGATQFLDRPFYHFDMRVIGNFARRPYKVDPVNFLGIPWAAVALWQTGFLVIVIAAIAQRGPDPLVWTVFAGLLTVAPIFYYLWTARPVSPVAATSPAIVAVAMLIWTQQVKFDVAPLILVFLLGAAAARRLATVCAVTTSAGAALLIGASITHHIEGVAVYLSLLAMALAVGYFVAIERDLFLAERRARRTLREQAADEERRRIAREIHDVVVHSLSITLLHVTGARRELQQDGDVDDAVGALVDAERLGRYAMADIRRTIGLLNTGPTSMTPEPGIDDISDLIHDFETAGLVVNSLIDGDYAHVTPSTGLGIYRICQESLTNVVKHAPSLKADMTLHISPTAISLSISNDIPNPAPATIHDAYSGAGLRGMKQRAQLLGGSLLAGSEQTRWTVQAQIPLSNQEPQSHEHSS